MFCSKCGHQIDDNAEFCENCGCKIKQTQTIDVEKSYKLVRFILTFFFRIYREHYYKSYGY